MKKKALVIIICTLLLAVGAFCAFWIYDGYIADKTEETVDIASLVAENADTAFGFLAENENVMPDEVRGYIIDPSVDIGGENGADSVFEKVDAILPNTVIIKYTSESETVKELAEKAKERGLYTVLLITGESDGEKILEIATECLVQAVMTDKADSAAEMKSLLNENGINFGILHEDAPNETSKKLVTEGSVDFCFVQINDSTETGAEDTVKKWSAIGLSCNTPVYGIVRNDLVKSGDGWTLTNEVITCVKMTYNYGGFGGCIMYSRSELAEDDNQTATNLFSYYEYFNNVDYTALTLTDVKTENDEKIILSGTSDVAFPVHMWCTANGKWQSVASEGENGSFSVIVPLSKGENKVVIKHKNARYTYYIDRAVDVLKEQSATVEDGVVTLTAKAVEGAKVYASLANTVSVELLPTGERSAGYEVYSAVYEIQPEYGALTAESISYAAAFGGIEDIVMCGQEKDITPYDDHGLGTATLCRTEFDYTETTSTASDDDTSDPTCTPQLSGAYGYAERIAVYDNNIVLYLTSGMKLHCDNTRLILGGFVMPDNAVKLESVSCGDNTTLTFSSSYGTFVKMVQAPQDYYKGYLDRIYNVEKFTAEYIDILFFNTSSCSYVTEPDFSESDVISKTEWYSNSEEKFMTLRLYLRSAGDFGGYSYEKTDGGKFTVTLKNKATALSGTVVMIDPGHGGYGNPGSNAEMTVYEKDVTLSVAAKAAEILEQNGVTVILTRQNDETLSLSERVALIREHDPDLFLSIHCDGSVDTSLYGTHTFYYRSYSKSLADAIHTQLVSAYRNYYYTDPASEAYTKLDMGVKFFPYMVARVEECPSVLIECGFLTNPADAALLTDSNGQKILAVAIAQGVVDYLSD